MINKKIVGFVITAAILLVPISQTMAQTLDTSNSGSVDLTNTPLGSNNKTTFALSAAVDAGGGQWDYGTSVVLGLIPKKKVYSNYNHTTKRHSSTAIIGTNTVRSGAVNKNQTSYASAIGATDDATHAYWNTYDDN